jgi:hypothetical protein
MRQALAGIENLPEDAVLSARSGATVGSVRHLAHAYLANDYSAHDYSAHDYSAGPK